jgi:four helix bundle protein
MATIKRFEELEIWKIAREFSRLVYSFTKRSPFDKDFSLKDQLRRSSGSMMDNPAEGFERGGRKEFIQFLIIAKGSAGEARSQLYRALDENHISKDEFEKAIALVENFSSKTQKFIEYLKKSEINGVRYKVEEPNTDYLIE